MLCLIDVDKLLPLGLALLFIKWHDEGGAQNGRGVKRTLIPTFKRARRMERDCDAATEQSHAHKRNGE